MVDISANLTDKHFDLDRDEVIKGAFEAGLAGLIVTGTNSAQSRRASTLVNKYLDYPFYSMAGVHPHEADRFDKDKDINSLRITLKNDRTVAIGECGLDYFRGFARPENQKECFKAQLELAVEIKKPLFLHERGAYDDFLECMDEYTEALKDIPKVVHCFTGTLEEVKAYLERGYYIGFTAFVGDRKRNEQTLPALREVPLDRLLVETDSPYMTPWFIKEKRNVPANVIEVVKMIAKIRHLRAYDLWNIICQNASKFFGLTLQDPLPNPMDPDEELREVRPHRESSGYRGRGRGQGRGQGRGRGRDNQDRDNSQYTRHSSKYTYSDLLFGNSDEPNSHRPPRSKEKNILTESNFPLGPVYPNSYYHEH